uniref:tRNA (uracil(54)-C(5))-methyltransferase n=1 Tax=Steinernema glaseri TaxID=37863 RepID=A0A1I7ZI15_9BILA
MVPEAIEDAKKNAAANGIGEDQFRFVAAKAEDVFKDLCYELPRGADLNKANVVGILDPPRAGIHERVIFTCRKMEKLNRIVFVSCDPKAALKNIVDLCRPRSRKYEGEPFQLERIQPVDMFPQTKHFEWVVTLVR